MIFCDYDSTNPTETCGKDGFRVWLSSSPRQRWPVVNPFGVVGGPRRALGTFGQSGEPRQCHTWRRFVDLEVTVVVVASASGCTSDHTISANRLGVKYRKVVHNFVFVPMKWVSFSFLQGWHCWKQTVIRKVSSFGCATSRQIYQLFWWIQWWIPTTSLTHLACLVFDVFGLPFPRPFLQEIHQLLEIPFGRATGHGKSTMAWTVSELASGNAEPSSMATERWSEDSAKHVLKGFGEDRGIGRWSKSVESGKMIEDVLLLLDVSVCNLGWSLAQFNSLHTALHAVTHVMSHALCTNSGSNLRHHQGRVQRFTCLCKHPLLIQLLAVTGSSHNFIVRRRVSNRKEWYSQGVAKRPFFLDVWMIVTWKASIFIEREIQKLDMKVRTAAKIIGLAD